MMTAIRQRRWLLIDADDTLWENNIYFERAFEEFADHLSHSTLTKAEVRAILDEIELANLAEHGYGSASYGRNLRQCFERLAERHVSEGELEQAEAIALKILEQPIELLAGVRETLEYLSGKHHLTLFTKGHHEEQLSKFSRSELGPLFHGVEVVREKDSQAYREIAVKERMIEDRTWMIGNSPKSDIHPALDAGLGAVFVPHENTWSLEIRELPEPSPRFAVVERFADLRWLF